MRKFFANPYSQFALFFFLGAGVTFFSGVYSGFHVQSNDFWSSVFYGRNMCRVELVSVQVFIDLSSGHKAFETAQSLSVYKFSSWDDRSIYDK